MKDTAATLESSSAPGREMAVRNPWTGEVAFTVQPSSADRISRGVQTAKAAFQRHLREPAHQRASWLNGAANALAKETEQLVEMIIAHIGKPRKAAVIEVNRTIAFIRACATYLPSLKGEVVPVDLVPAGAGLFG